MLAESEKVNRNYDDLDATDQPHVLNKSKCQAKVLVEFETAEVLKREVKNTQKKSSEGACKESKEY